MPRSLLLSLLLATAFRWLPAQAADSLQADTVFLRAQRLVSAGLGDSARALVAGELRRAVPGSPHYIEALYWRAAFAATAADAERDLQRIVVEFPLSDWADDALLRLAQLEIARTQRPQATWHLERLLLEHPASPLRARAAFTLARLHLDQNQLPRGCARLEDAARSASPTDVELRNQIDYLRQRCVGVDTAGARAVAGAARQPNPAPATTAPPAAGAPRRAAQYSVQVAALRSPGEAEQMRERLAARGYDARVFASGSYWRVRVGRYDTRDAAAAALTRMRASGLTGFVVEAEPR